MSKKKLIIVDISSFIFRAFYAIRPLTSPQGVPVNAVYGVLSMMLKLMSEHRPTHMFLARDTKDGSFRKELYPLYKANRSEPPEDLIPQFALIETLIEKLDFKELAVPMYEADDVIASAVVQWRNYFDEIYIASGDKDLMQFVDNKVKILDTMKDKIYGDVDVKEKMGVRPDQILDYLSMVGDASDNVPGMKGIGEKGASKLLEEYGTLENCHAHLEDITNKRVKNAFTEFWNDGLLSKKLITLETSLELKTTAEETLFSFYPQQKLLDFMDDLGFKSFKLKLMELARIEDSSPVENPKVEIKTILINNTEAFASFKTLLKNEKKISVSWSMDQSENDRNSQKVKEFAIHWGAEDYLLNFKTSQDLLDMGEGLSADEFNDLLQILGEKDKFIIGHDLKYFFYLYLIQKLNFEGSFFDVAQASFVINPEKKHALNEISQNYLGQSSVEQLADRNHAQFLLLPILSEKLKELKLETVFYQVDQPLIPILAQMEFHGVSFDHKFYTNLEHEFTSELSKIEKAIHDLTKEDINLKSPKQVSALLFEKLNLPVIRKTKTGSSTDSDVLQELEALNISPVPALILQYREMDKLLSTYVKALPKMISPVTGKIHTHFQQFNAATGRLSSDSPNLQNIPIRSENGRRLRKGFIASPGKILLSADYSQVELRILAHFSDDPVMVAAFKNGLDIHAQTASEMFEKPLAEVSKDERSRAKAINFGLMYGQSSYGLSQNLHIDRSTARDFITEYFMRFKKVKAYLDSLKEFAEKSGYSQTLLGRKRILSDIRSTNRTIKSMAERMAVNTPIQGTAADIIKVAMINIVKEMKEKKCKSTLLLQVHDELIFECYPEELELMKELVKRDMEHAVELKVPLEVDMGTGTNWYDLK
ncbi:MAG: DNA polymerase I [Bacteriovoracaceae bacterium]